MEGLELNWNVIIGALGPTGILVWYLWYTTTITLPRKDAEFTAVLNKIVTDFRADLREERIARTSEIRALREAFGCQASAREREREAGREARDREVARDVARDEDERNQA